MVDYRMKAESGNFALAGSDVKMYRGNRAFFWAAYFLSLSVAADVIDLVGVPQPYGPIAFALFAVAAAMLFLFNRRFGDWLMNKRDG